MTMDEQKFYEIMNNGLDGFADREKHLAILGITLQDYYDFCNGKYNKINIHLIDPSTNTSHSLLINANSFNVTTSDYKYVLFVGTFALDSLDPVVKHFTFVCIPTELSFNIRIQ